jgi:hypothetical protein
MAQLAASEPWRKSMKTSPASIRKIYRNLGTIFGAAQFILFDPATESVVFTDVEKELEKKIKSVVGEDYSTIFITSATSRISVTTPDGERVEYDQTDDDILTNLRRITIKAYSVFLTEEKSEVSMAHLLEEHLPNLSPVDGEDYRKISVIRRSDTEIEVQRPNGRRVCFSISGWLEDDEDDEAES